MGWAGLGWAGHAVIYKLNGHAVIDFNSVGSLVKNQSDRFLITTTTKARNLQENIIMALKTAFLWVFLQLSLSWALCYVRAKLLPPRCNEKLRLVKKIVVEHLRICTLCGDSVRPREVVCNLKVCRHDFHYDCFQRPEAHCPFCNAHLPRFNQSNLFMTTANQPPTWVPTTVQQAPPRAPLLPDRSTSSINFHFQHPMMPRMPAYQDNVDLPLVPRPIYRPRRDA